MPKLWGYSSVGRAPALQAGGQGFESLYLHSVERLNMYLENYTLTLYQIDIRTDIKHQIQFFENKTKNQDIYRNTNKVCRRPSEEGRRVDALALRAEERRDKLRKATGRSKYSLIRRFLNVETYLRKPQVSISESIAYGREPGELKHLSSRRKRKKHRFPK